MPWASSRALFNIPIKNSSGTPPYLRSAIKFFERNVFFGRELQDGK